MPSRTITCGLCGDAIRVPPAPWEDQLEFVQEWMTGHGQAEHDGDIELPISVVPDPIAEP
jgi:hypothetical protein